MTQPQPTRMTCDVLDRPLTWQRRGLTYTASGYGAKIPSSRCLQTPDGKIRRIYVTQYGNAGTEWIVYQGHRYIVDPWASDVRTVLDLSRTFGV